MKITKAQLKQIIKEELSQQLGHQQNLSLGSQEEYEAYDKWKSMQPESQLSFEDFKALHAAAWNASFDAVSSGTKPKPKNKEELDNLIWTLMAEMGQ